MSERSYNIYFKDTKKTLKRTKTIHLISLRYGGGQYEINEVNLCTLNEPSNKMNVCYYNFDM